MITLVVPVPPISNTRLKAGGGHLYRSKESTDYQAAVRAICVDGKIKPYPGPVWVSLTWYRARKAGDLPDRFKDLYDALQSRGNYGFGAYKDDAQIEMEIKRRLDTDPRHPRIEIKISAAYEDGGVACGCSRSGAAVNSSQGSIS